MHIISVVILFMQRYITIALNSHLVYGPVADIDL